MATTAASRTPPLRRPLSGSPSPPSNSISKGATARSAVPPRATSSLGSSTIRRSSTLKERPPHSSAANGAAREYLSEALKQEIEQKEQLLVQIQNKDQTITNLSSENDSLSSALNSAETRVNELYADQNRMEDEMATRIEVAEKLRSQVRELEKEKREIQVRYNEQTLSFEAERQSFYDNEQHLKSRIQSLTQVRKQSEITTSVLEPEADQDDSDSGAHQSLHNYMQDRKQDVNDPQTEPAEMTSLKLELSTLSTSYASLQSTLVLLQTQLVDLKRVNHELQEENESYLILLRERTLSGLFDPMKQVGGGSSSSDGEEDEDDEGMSVTDDAGDLGSLKGIARNTLDKVDETPEESLEHDPGQDLEPQLPPSRTSRSSRHNRGRATTTSHSPTSTPRGESLANLPITGPGLDLAAELGRAENKDILDGKAVESTDRSLLKSKKGKKHGRKLSDEGLEPSGSTNDIDVLRTEVKSLKDANKALSLYASKIIDRIISQEGFEHVLAADYDKQTPTPSPATAVPKSGPNSFLSPLPKKPRSQTIMGLRATSNPEQEAMATPNSPGSSARKVTLSTPNPKAQRRSLSFDWKSFSMFGGTDKKEPPSLRPLTLSTSSVTSARKLETQEDEDDRREREQLHATMKLMGIQPNMSSPLPATSVIPPTPITKSISSPASPPPQSASRFSFFTRSTTTNSDTSSIRSTTPSTNSSQYLGHGTDRPSSLTQAALEQAETENTLAALDAHERILSSEIANGSSGGFTEIPRRGGEGRRSRRSKISGGGSGSGSTVWSAGIGEEGDE